MLDRLLSKDEPEDDEPRRLDLRLLVAAGVAWGLVLAGLRMPALWVAVMAVGCLCVTGICVWGERRSLATGFDHFTATPRPLKWTWRTRTYRRDAIYPRLVAVGALGGAVSALCLCATAGHLAVRSAGPIGELSQTSAIVRVEAVVTSDPRAVAAGVGGAQRLVITTVSVRQVVARGAVSTTTTPVLVLGDERWLEVHWHQRISFTGRLKPAEAGDDVAAILTARGAPTVLAGAGPLLGAIEGLRADTRQATSSLPADPRGLVPALVIGDTSAMPQELNDDMRATGMSHLNAVSGSNVTLVLMSVIWLSGWLRIRGRWRLIFAGAALVLFVLLCRPQPSVIRAAAMGAVGLLGVSVARRAAGPPALAAAVVVLLIYDPWLAASYGFALSTLATAGLLFFARPWADWFARFLPSRLRRLADAVAIPVAAQAFCAPVIVLLQGSVSLIGLPANVLAAPLVAPATLAGVITVVVAGFSTSVAAVPAWLAGLPAWGIAWVAHAAARVPMGSLPWVPGTVGALLLAALVLLLLLSGPWLARAALRRPWLAGGLALVIAAVWTPMPSLGWPPPGWVYVACDVGQGDGGALATSSGHAVVVDAGPEPGPMAACLDRLGIQVVDALVLTHFHADHVGGIDGVFAGRTVRAVYVTPVEPGGQQSGGDEPSDEPLVHQVSAAHRLTPQPLKTGDTLTFTGLQATVVWPSRVLHAGSEQNNASIVLDVHSRGLRIVLTGDIEKEAAAAALRELRKAPDGTHVDVLKVPHHGSANQDPDFEHELQATIGVISVGADNDYGHPTAKTLDLLRDSGTAVVRTDRGGDIAVVSRDGHALIARP
ncbi:DNA internalization-related competence protein ComEC/Rec2 [Rudaeicoccus suwonensis]|uniref:DNA internalization-related competence protein ComEC/Rec2 n=1 Tax=Rudaeicoccus suwonensis TaxID=657409 RepID=UPI0011A72E7A|nr:DNA internalization-related competence protein ComEC/Rec2 [Rudaeicoccus suwonensis]